MQKPKPKLGNEEGREEGRRRKKGGRRVDGREREKWGGGGGRKGRTREKTEEEGIPYTNISDHSSVDYSLDGAPKHAS